MVVSILLSRGTPDGKGDYTIDQVPEGTYDVTASASDFVSETLFNVGVLAGSTVSVASITYATEGGRNQDKASFDDRRS